MKKTSMFLILIILMSAYRPVIHYLLPELGEYETTLLRKALQAGTVIAFITKAGMWDKVGGLRKISKSSLLLILPVFLLSFCTYLYGVKVTFVWDILILIPITLLIGVIEELEFRGVIYTYLEQEGTVIKIMLSSLLFGLVHLLNLFYTRDLLGVIVQMIFATGIGMIFAVVRHKTNLILPQILMHALWDFNQKMTNNNSSEPVVDIINYSSLALVILYGCFMVYWVRKEKKPALEIS